MYFLGSFPEVVLHAVSFFWTWLVEFFFSFFLFQNIQCYVCKKFGHLCCVNSTSDTSVVSCYKCGQTGHTGLVSPFCLSDCIRCSHDTYITFHFHLTFSLVLFMFYFYMQLSSCFALTPVGSSHPKILTPVLDFADSWALNSFRFLVLFNDSVFSYADQIIGIDEMLIFACNYRVQCLLSQTCEQVGEGQYWQGLYCCFCLVLLDASVHGGWNI